MEKSAFQHKQWLELARAIATFSVIILHTSAPILYRLNDISREYWWVGNIYDSIVRFSVPVFFMISGSLLLSRDYTMKDFFLKRFWRIIPPFIFWSLIYIFFDMYISNTFHFNIEFGKLILRNLFYGSQFHLWFIYTLLGLYLLIPILRKWIKTATQREILYFLVLWLIASIYTTSNLNYYFPKIELRYFSGFIGYLILGFYLTNLSQDFKKTSTFLLVAGVMVTIIGTYLLSNDNNEFSSFFYNHLSPNVIASSIGIFLLIKNMVIQNIFVKRLIAFISNHSFGIYLSHVLVLRILDKIEVNWKIAHPTISIPTVAIICLMISGIGIYYIRKIKIGKYISG